MKSVCKRCWPLWGVIGLCFSLSATVNAKDYHFKVSSGFHPSPTWKTSDSDLGPIFLLTFPQGAKLNPKPTADEFINSIQKSFFQGPVCKNEPSGIAYCLMNIWLRDIDDDGLIDEVMAGQSIHQARTPKTRDEVDHLTNLAMSDENYGLKTEFKKIKHFNVSQSLIAIKDQAVIGELGSFSYEIEFSDYFKKIFYYELALLKSGLPNLLILFSDYLSWGLIKSFANEKIPIADFLILKYDTRAVFENGTLGDPWISDHREGLDCRIETPSGHCIADLPFAF